MINLLPPETKTAIRYSRYNAVIRRYIGLVILVIVLLVATQFGSRYYLRQRIQTTTEHVASLKQQISHYSDLQSKATALNTRLTAIQSVQKSQAKFSVLLSDLAQYMPQGTAISSITLTGDAKQPVRLTVNAVDYKTALGFRDSIARSPRVSAADIESIQAANNLYVVTVVFAFQPGAAK